MFPENAPPAEPVSARSAESASPAARRRRLRQRGVSLVELSVVVTITGILATLATYSVRERVYEAHSIEAISMLGNIRTGLLAKSDKLTGNSGDTLQIGGRVGGFGGPLGLPGLLGAPGNGNGNDDDDTSGSDASTNDNKTDSDGDGNNGHGNNEGGCDPDNPGNSGGNCTGNDSGSGDDSNGNGNDNGGNDGGGADGDGDKGHGNNDSGCDPDNPGNGGAHCGGGNGSNNGNDGSGSGSDVEAGNSLCGSADPVPSSLDSVKGGLYQSRPSDWVSSTNSGWTCLSVSMSMAQRFQYGYDVGASAVPGGAAPSGADTSLAAWARGDLDGDGRTSWFVLSGASYDGQVTMAPAVTMIDKGE